MAGNTGGHAPVIIKRVKKGGGDGHHGGAWKVAYADFVTAMMAFFLLMWLLNATSEEQLHGLADYFDPSLPISRNSAGGAGMLQGDTMFTPERVAGSAPDGERARPSHTDPGEPLGSEDGFIADPTGAGPDPAPEGIAAAPEAGAGPTEAPDSSAAPATGAPVVREDTADPAGDDLAAVGEDLLTRVRDAAGGDGLMRHFSMRMTPEGLVIEIADADGAPLFMPGSAEPAAVMRGLLDVVVPILGRVANDIAITGHTDAVPFHRRESYGNWELSADRANAARRLMIGLGLDASRVARVSGQGATRPLSDDPLAPQNRRIAIILLREGLGR